MNPKLGLALALLIIAPTVLGQQSSIVDDIVRSHDPIEVGDHEITFSWVPEENRTFVRVPVGSNIIVDGISCKNNAFFTACVDQVLNPTWNETLHRNIYDLDVRLVQRIPDIDYEFTLEKVNFTQGELSTASIAITNPSSTFAGNISVSWSLPGFQFSDVSGCQVVGDRLDINGSLTSYAELSCTASVYAADELTYMSNTTLHVQNGFSTINQTNRTSIRISPSIATVSREYDQEMFEQEQQLVKYTITNIQNKSLRVNLMQLSLSTGLQFSSLPSGFNKSAGSIQRSFNLAMNESKTIAVPVQATIPGRLAIHERYEFSTEDKQDGFVTRLPLGVLSFVPQLYAQLVPHNLTQGQEGALLVSLYNPHPRLDMKNATVSVESSYEPVSITDSLSPRENRTVLLYQFNLSEEQAGEEVTFLMKVDFEGRTRSLSVQGHVHDTTNNTAPLELEELISINSVNTTVAIKTSTNESVQKQEEKEEEEKWRYEGENFGHVQRLPSDLPKWEVNGIPFFPTIFYILGAIAVVVLVSIYYIKKKGKEREETPYEIDRVKQMGEE